MEWAPSARASSLPSNRMAPWLQRHPPPCTRPVAPLPTGVPSHFSPNSEVCQGLVVAPSQPSAVMPLHGQWYGLIGQDRSPGLQTSCLLAAENGAFHLREVPVCVCVVIAHPFTWLCALGTSKEVCTFQVNSCWSSMPGIFVSSSHQDSISTCWACHPIQSKVLRGEGSRSLCSDLDTSVNGRPSSTSVPAGDGSSSPKWDDLIYILGLSPIWLIIFVMYIFYLILVCHMSHVMLVWYH